MKATFLLISLASLGLVFAGCESDLPPDPDTGAQNKLERGISGHGTLSSPSQPYDSTSSDNSNGGN